LALAIAGSDVTGTPVRGNARLTGVP
jgi:hypothetical protein